MKNLLKKTLKTSKVGLLAMGLSMGLANCAADDATANNTSGSTVVCASTDLYCDHFDSDSGKWILDKPSGTANPTLSFANSVLKMTSNQVQTYWGAHDSTLAGLKPTNISVRFRRNQNQSAYISIYNITNNLLNLQCFIGEDNIVKCDGLSWGRSTGVAVAVNTWCVLGIKNIDYLNNTFDVEVDGVTKLTRERMNNNMPTGIYTIRISGSALNYSAVGDSVEFDYIKMW